MPTNQNKKSKDEYISEISKALQSKRKDRNASLEKVSQALKIRVPVLRALENGNWDDLPGGVYLKGFLKQYATYLGLDADKLIKPYFQSNGFHKKNSEDDEAESTADSDRSTKIVWISVSFGIIFLLALIKFISMNNNNAIQKPQEPAEAAVTADVSAVGEEEEAPIAQPVVETHTLNVYSPYPLWLGVEAEDRSFEGFIPEGSTWEWRGNGKFSIRLGHTREIKMLFDGQVVELTEDQKRVDLPNDN